MIHCPKEKCSCCNCSFNIYSSCVFKESTIEIISTHRKTICIRTWNPNTFLRAMEFVPTIYSPKKKTILVLSISV
jgi:hypothetical protein